MFLASLQVHEHALQVYYVAQRSKATLQCNPDDSVASDLTAKKYIETQCFLQYAQEFYPPLPIYTLLVANLGIAVAVSMVYGYLAKRRVQKYADSPTAVKANNADDENQLPFVANISPAASDPIAYRNPDSLWVFILYTLHLIFRVIVLVVFAAILLGSSSNYPTQFQCSWLAKATSVPHTNITPSRNYSLVDCTYPIGGNHEKIAVSAASINLLFCTVALAEFGYLLRSATKYDDFCTEMEFCCVYILRKRKRIRKLIKKIRQNISDDVFHLYDDFGEKDLSRRKLKDMYVNVIIQDGREDVLISPRFHDDRHTIYEAHLMSAKNAIALEKTADLFANYRKSILVVGRPGIGKTLLTKKIFYQWQQQKIEFWHDKIVLLIRFRSFNNERISLWEMLRRSDGLNMSSKDFNHIYEYICLKSKNVILIFDGLDELKVDNQSSATENVVSSHNEATHALSILKQLLNRELLPKSTVLTTSWPTAEHIYNVLDFKRKVEILGFSEKQIKEYVDKFCLNDMSKSEEIFTLIKQSAELFSLCYVPVNCYIVCLTLLETIEQAGDNFQSNVPVTITELYKRAIKILLFKHHAQYRTKQPPKDYFITKLPAVLQKDLHELKAIARNGMEDDKLIFELESADKLLDELSDCGLFNKLNDKRRNLFCFLHLTIQEFLAAMHVVDDMAKVDKVLSERIHNPKWHLVIQFVAGLVGDKIRELKTNEILSERFYSSLPREEVNVYRNCHLPVIKWLHEVQEVDVMSSAVRDKYGMSAAECRLDAMHVAPVDTSALFGFLSCMEFMEKLDINQCTMEKYAVLELAKLLGKIGITQLIINKSRLADDIAESISFVLTYNDNCKISSLSLLGIGFPCKDMSCFLSDALVSGKCSQLVELRMNENLLTHKNAKHLSDALKNSNCKLTKLNLSINGLENEGAQFVAEALQSRNCKLTSLNINSNKLEKRSAEFLCEALKSDNCKLTELDLSDNNLTDEGVEKIADALKTRKCKLAELNLRNTKLTEHSGKHLKNAMARSGVLKKIARSLHFPKASESRKCSNLAVLDISSNSLGDKGAFCLSIALKDDYCNLSKLNISGNKLTDDGAKHVSDALKSGYCRLAKLNISNNKITDKGAEHFGDAMKNKKCKLVKLDLSSNTLITDQDAQYLNDLRKIGKVIMI